MRKKTIQELWQMLKYNERQYEMVLASAERVHGRQRKMLMNLLNELEAEHDRIAGMFPAEYW